MHFQLTYLKKYSNKEVWSVTTDKTTVVTLKAFEDFKLQMPFHEINVNKPSATADAFIPKFAFLIVFISEDFPTFGMPITITLNKSRMSRLEKRRKDVAVNQLPSGNWKFEVVTLFISVTEEEC